MNSSICNLLHLFFIALFTFPFVICILGSSEILCIPSERETLVKFKHHLIDPSNRLSSWNATSNANCCEWEGVVCSNLTSHVTQLHLNISPPSYYYGYHYIDRYEAYDRSRFGGEINPCLVDLKHLNYLDFSGNYFGGMQIPTFFGAITSLTYLNLSNAGFGGNIPFQIGNLSNLIYLDLRSGDYDLKLKNDFSGEIPYQIGNLTNLLHLDIGNDYSEALFAKNLRWLLGVSKLEYLDLSSVNLSKSFDWLQVTQSLPSLVELHLTTFPLHGYNQPSTLNFSSLLTLHLSFSYHLGISFFPEWICGLTKLISLQLINNNIQGSIPDGLQNLTLLENLVLTDNSFSSSIPDWIYGLHHLKFLSLGFNNLNGTIPDMLGNMTSLVGLDLSGNQFEGKIPTSLGNFCKLRDLYLSDLNLNQQVNEILEILTSCASDGLEYLEIASSKLSGHLTDRIGEFKILVSLSLRNNSIHSALPRSFEKLSWLRILDLSNNQFNGNAFENLISLSKLSSIIIDDNHFEGVVKEDDLANLTNLQSLMASGNNFSLKVSPNWNPNFQLIFLGLNSWNLGPKFPSWIQSQKNLMGLEMSNTGISSPIPTWFWETFSQADGLDLSHNHIHGELVNSLKNPISITSLDLSSNQLSGQLPQLSAKVMDLAQNSLSELRAVSMILWLKGRNDEYRNILGLVTSIDLSNNKLSGEIPTEITNLDGLVYLNLSHNQLSGHIPQSIGNMGQLLNIDFSQNLLSGEIPLGVANLSFVSLLNLSYNHLKGKIPTSTQLQTLEASNFVGNNLCGLPLPINCSLDGQIANDDHNSNEDDGHKVNWFFVSMALGFVVGFWIVVAPLFIYKSWRYVYFRFLDNVWFKLQCFLVK
ncbi:hypothetical protein VNO77_33577 [Canavalia gladiata]|uniref:Leucine-rich repeat-containing N-terminal plant-type domain-containing protein n=1 Tax=Canavalia gladiata TaxID=3824 RepID=A0AAN9KCN2_CANGL